MNERQAIGKRIKQTRFERDKKAVKTIIVFEDDSTLTIGAYCKDTIWQIALGREPHQVGMKWDSEIANFTVCHQRHGRNDNDDLRQCWRNQSLDDIHNEDETFSIVVGGKKWQPSIAYLTPLGINDHPTEYIGTSYRSAEEVAGT